MMRYINRKLLFEIAPIVGGGLLLGWLGCDAALARDLGSAATTYTNTIKTIGQLMSVAGVVAGGICMQIPGVANFGKGVLSGGLVGGLCSFGAPAFVSLLTNVFGGG